MRITFESSGGIGGLALSFVAETARLDPVLAHDLEELVAESGLMDPLPPVPPDEMPEDLEAAELTYHLTLTRGPVSRSYTLTESTAPPEAAPLIDLLADLARRP